MRAWDSVTKGGSLRPGPAGLSILLAGVLLSLAPVSTRIEQGFYDLIQGLQGTAGSPQIVIVDTSKLDDGAGSLWEAARFPDVLRALGKAGARLVIALDPPPMANTLPDAAQLAALTEIERRGGAGPDGSAFARRLTAMRHRAELHTATLAAIGSLRNTIISMPTYESTRTAAASMTGGCARHLMEAVTAAPDAAAIPMRQVRAVAAPPDPICRVALGAGHAEFWPDADGIVRRHDLLVGAAGGRLPSVALRAALALTFPSGTPPTLEVDAIRWDKRSIPTSGGAGALLRFYPGQNQHPAFDIVPAGQLLGSNAEARRVAGHIVILGHGSLAATDTGYATPIEDRATPALLVATALSNILQEDYIVRPAWLHWLEISLMVLIGIAILRWGHAIPTALTLMIGLCGGAALLAIEAYLLLGPGLWTQLGSVALFAVVASGTVRLAHPAAGAGSTPLLPAVAAAGSPAPAAEKASAGDELDMAFSVLRHQPPSAHVKERLYEVALEHARQRDLAKAERVLRHLAGIDPDYRHAGEKLKKLAGMRSGLQGEQGQPPQTPALRPVLKPVVDEPVLSGQTIGRYQIEDAIGRGAMATVYLGRDPKINRRVAIKTIALAEEFTDSDLVNAKTQFLREAESAGRLNHPNIISIYDAGEDGQVAYLAMEYFPGKSLSHYAQPGNLLPPRRVLELMARAAEALHYAHGQHVVHRDIKPANIMYDRETDSLKITDFGIARLTDSSRTKTGIILGTPSYMSPEQLAGTNVTGQSDLFSLGITLFQLLTGNPPFRADSIPRLMQKIAHERHPSVREARDDLPACIDGVLDRALAKDPSDRYPSGRAMALALRDCCSRLDSTSPARSS